MTKNEDFDNPLVQAAKVIKKGGLVVFPTETVYGLGANALNIQAVKKIFKTKKRPIDNPLIVHIAEKKDLQKIVTSVSAVAKKLIDKFWPGPLTIIFKKKNIIPNEVTAGLETVAVRLPNHALARAFIREAGVPIAAPSANFSGRPSPTEVSHAKKDLGKKTIFILDGGRSKFGIESTIINVLEKIPIILRQGAITREALQKVLGRVEVLDPKNSKIISPGTHHRHYAPRTKLLLVGSDWQTTSKEIESAIIKYNSQNKKVGVLGTRENYHFYKKADRVLLLGSQKNLSACAVNLYKSFRDFDRFGDVDLILAEVFPEKELGAVIMDRLRRATSH